MRAHDAWRAFTVLFALALAIVSAFMISRGVEFIVVIFVAVVAVAVYLYIVYKRYHVELITEDDLRLFDDSEDLRILCRIYGLPHKGASKRLRYRLAQYARMNSGRSFVWVAPMFMKNFVSALEFAPGMYEDEELPEDSNELLVRMISGRGPAGVANRPLVWGMCRSPSRRRAITACPVCDASVGQRAPVCGECGADLEFYDALTESKIGRRLVAQKSDGQGRKV